MTEVTIDRELLERLANEFETETEWNCANVPAGTRAATTRAIAMKSMADELRAILAAPRQPEGDHGWLVSLELREECERLRKITSVTMGVGSGGGQLFVHGDYDSIKAAQAIVLERDTLRQQLAERDAELKKVNADRLSCWAEFKVMTRACLKAEKQRDKLAWLLCDAEAELEDWRRSFPDANSIDTDQLLERIDAALAEVKP